MKPYGIHPSETVNIVTYFKSRGPMGFTQKNTKVPNHTVFRGDLKKFDVVYILKADALWHLPKEYKRNFRNKPYYY